MSCNQLDGNLTGSIGASFNTASIFAFFNEGSSPRVNSIVLNQTPPTSSLQGILTSSLQSSYHSFLGTYYDTESMYHTYELQASLSSSLDMCYFNPPLT